MTLGSNHPLLKRAFVYPGGTKVPDLTGCWYDPRLGVWLTIEGDKTVPLVKSNNPEKPRPVTKKADRETGEDLKGT